MSVEIDQQAPIPDGPVLFAANHRSLVDVFVSLIGLYRIGRPTRFIVGRAFFRKPGLGMVLRAIGAIEGGRGSGADVVAIRAIEAGETCAIMPEGRVTTVEAGHILAPLLPGVAEIWAKAQCPFVAAGISGAGDVWPHGRRLPPLPRRRRTRPLVHVRFEVPVPAADPPWDLARIAEHMEATCVLSRNDRAAALERAAP